MIKNQQKQNSEAIDLLSLSSRIRQFRELRNFTQEYIAGELGLSQNSYSRLERNPGKLNLNRLNRIIQVLEISPEDLFRKEVVYQLSR